MDNVDDVALRHVTVNAIDILAKDAIFWGTNPLKLWDQVSTRIRASARQSTSPQEWGSRMLRGLRVGTPSVASSKALTELAMVVGPERRVVDHWLAMLERETGFLVAEVRARRDEAKTRREEERAARGEAPEPKPSRKRKAKAETPEKSTETEPAPTGEQETLWNK